MEIINQFIQEVPLDTFILVMVGFLALLFTLKCIRPKTRHERKIKSASKAIKKINNIESPAMKLCYLRKVDPFCFEEMILTALYKQGHKIERNRRYTGDNGMDGKCRINGINYLIQAKRYRGHINNKHVIEFANLCTREKKRGILFHTGKTGKKSLDIVSMNKHIQIISGSNLIRLFSDDNLMIS